MRPPPAVREVGLLDEDAVRHDLIVRRRRDDELAGRLVVRVVDHREPVARAVRPVLAEDGPLAVDVRDEAQPFRRHAAILNREGDVLTLRDAPRKPDPQAIISCENVARLTPFVTDETVIPPRSPADARSSTASVTLSSAIRSCTVASPATSFDESTSVNRNT